MELAEHPQLSREDIKSFGNFLGIRSAHQYADFKNQMQKLTDDFAFIGEYVSKHKLRYSKSLVKSIQNMMAGAAH